VTSSVCFAHAADRVALVIGNQAYRDGALDNPAADADAMAKVLEAKGFKVVRLRDATRAQMQQALAQTQQLLAGRKGVGLFYYSGHAVQLDWRNYLIPIDARLGQPRDVAAQTLDLAAVLDAFKAAGTRMNIVVLDACRNNPFGSAGAGRGLAQMDAPWGTFLAYSTAPGNVAEDNTLGLGNSLYTQHLVQEIARPRARIEDVFKRVRLQVRQRSEGRQIPWESTSLEDEFLFDEGLKAAVEPDEGTKERVFAQERAEWETVVATKDLDAIYAYLQRHPLGSFSELAQALVERFQVAKVVPQAGPDGVVATDWRSRFRHGDRYEFVFRDGLTGLRKSNGSVVLKVTGDEVEGVGTGMANVRSLRGELLVEDGGGTYSPPWPIVPGGGIQMGLRSKGRTVRTSANGQQQTIDFDSRVVGRETITLPIGTIDCWKVEVDFAPGAGRREFTFWIDPLWGYAVKAIYESRDNRGTADITIREMVSRTRGP
jgi:hypothetical protein